MKTDQTFLDSALRRFQDAATASQEVRAKALEARRFVSIPGAQWDGDGWSAMSTNMIRVEINKTARGLRKIVNDYRSNRVIVDYRAVGDKASEDTAETLDGLFRADLYRSKGQQAFDNGFEEGAKGGFGAWRLYNEREDEYDPDNDHQRICIAAIVDADQSVYFDPNSKLYDKSDAKWACVITAWSKDAFAEEFPDATAADWPQGVPRLIYDWFTPEVVRVADWYQVEITTEKLWIFTNRVTKQEQRFWDSEIDASDRADLRAQGWKSKSQDRKRRRVQKRKFSGAEELEAPTYIAGDQIPIIPFYGDRSYIDNQERFIGHVQLAMDPQRAYNTQISKLIETAALTPREVPIVAPEQMVGHAEDWARANIDRLPYLRLNPIINPITGEMLAAGPVAKLDPPQLPPVLGAVIQITANDIAELTNADDTTTQTKSNVSAEAMDIASTRFDSMSGGYMDHMRLSMQRCGEVYQSMSRDVYFEPKRKVQTRGPDGEEGEATLNEPVMDESGVYRMRNDLSSGKYEVVADVQEATGTRRDKTVRTLTNVAQLQIGAQDMEGAQASIITIVMNLDGEGIDDYQDWNRKRALGLGLVKPTPEEQQQMEKEAQDKGQQPDPSKLAIMAQAKALDGQGNEANAKAKDLEASAVQRLADAHLKSAQASAVGGPDAAPSPPTGLEHAASVADIADKAAGAQLKVAQAHKITTEAAHIPSDHHVKAIKTGHDIEMQRRQQDQAEKPQAQDEAA